MQPSPRSSPASAAVEVLSVLRVGDFVFSTRQQTCSGFAKMKSRIYLLAEGMDTA
jgi:hypothetical protein